MTIDPAALIPDAALAAAVRRISPITLAPRRGSERRRDRADGARAVHQPGRDPANGRAGSRRRRAPCRAVPLPRGHGAGRRPDLAAGALGGRRRPVGDADRPSRSRRRATGGQASTREGARADRPRPPDSAPPPTAWRDGRGPCRSKPARSAGRQINAASTPRGTPAIWRRLACSARRGCCSPRMGATPERAGCLTPATALGTACIDRFERARVRFSVEP